MQFRRGCNAAGRKRNSREGGARVKQLAVFVCLALVVVLAACGTGDDGVTGPREPRGSHPEVPVGKSRSAVEVEPVTTRVETSPGSPRAACAGSGGSAAACRVRDVGGHQLFSTAPDGSAAYTEVGAPTVEEVLESGLKLAKASPSEWIRTSARRGGQPRFSSLNSRMFTPQKGPHHVEPSAAPSQERDGLCLCNGERG